MNQTLAKVAQYMTFMPPHEIVFDQIMYLQAFSGMGLHFLKVEYV